MRVTHKLSGIDWVYSGMGAMGLTTRFPSCSYFSYAWLTVSDNMTNTIQCSKFLTLEHIFWYGTASYQ